MCAACCRSCGKGHPKRQAADIHQFIISPIEAHSKKPDETREKIVALMGDLPRLGRVEADVMGKLKRLGVQSRPLDGRDRLSILHGQMHPGGREPFRFTWRDIPKIGMGTKDFIAPDGFDFRQSRTLVL